MPTPRWGHATLHDSRPEWAVIPEKFDPAILPRGKWSKLSNRSNSTDSTRKRVALYPFMFPLRTGKVFYGGNGPEDNSSGRRCFVLKDSTWISVASADELCGSAVYVGTGVKDTVMKCGGIDVNDDGWRDLVIANGHVYPEIEQVSPGTHYKQVNSLFHNEYGKKFSEVGALAGIATLPPHAGRGVVFADFDNDGFTDILVANNGDPPLLLRNGGNSNHFLNLKLIGVKSNRDAIGARVRVTSGGISQIREITGGGSYLSQNDLRANFGLGNARNVEMVEIKWPRPSSTVERFTGLPIDRYITIVEGEGKWK